MEFILYKELVTRNQSVHSHWAELEYQLTDIIKKPIIVNSYMNAICCMQLSHFIYLTTNFGDLCTFTTFGFSILVKLTKGYLERVFWLLIINQMIKLNSSRYLVAE